MIGNMWNAPWLHVPSELLEAITVISYIRNSLKLYQRLQMLMRKALLSSRTHLHSLVLEVALTVPSTSHFEDSIND